MRSFDPITLRRIAAEIREEQFKLDDLFQEWESHRLGDWQDSFFLRGKGSIFHDFYCSVEYRQVKKRLDQIFSRPHQNHLA